jgi:hypothetical protein
MTVSTASHSAANHGKIVEIPGFRNTVPGGQHHAGSDHCAGAGIKPDPILNKQQGAHMGMFTTVRFTPRDRPCGTGNRQPNDQNENKRDCIFLHFIFS